MSHRFTAYLGCTGIVAVLVIAFPGIVLFGLLAGVVPGILLGITPSLFCYSLAWWATRALVLKAAAVRWAAPTSDVGRRALRTAAGGLAVVIVALPALLVPQVMNSSLAGRVAALRADDRDVAAPLAFPPVIAIALSDNYDWLHKQLFCETLCQRLLYSGSVSRVVVADAIPQRAVGAFWIERRGQCPEPALPHSEVRWAVDFPLNRGDAPEEQVRARIARGECLIQGAGSLDEAGVIIAFRKIKEGASIFANPWSLSLDTVAATRLEIVDREGRALYRRTEVKNQPLVVPLLIDARAGLLTSVTYVGWARSETTDGAIGPNGRDVLPGLLGPAARLSDRAAR
jgi:hypothetical protein